MSSTRSTSPVATLSRCTTPPWDALVNSATGRRRRSDLRVRGVSVQDGRLTRPSAGRSWPRRAKPSPLIYRRSECVYNRHGHEVLADGRVPSVSPICAAAARLHHGHRNRRGHHFNQGRMFLCGQNVVAARIPVRTICQRRQLVPRDRGPELYGAGDLVRRLLSRDSEPEPFCERFPPPTAPRNRVAITVV